MGNCCSAPKTQQQQERQYTTAAGQSLQGRDVTQQTKKVGLSGSFQAVKLLGRGAAADIWLFRDLKHGNQVAVKLFERPLPQAAKEAVLREIKVTAEIRLAANSRSEQVMVKGKSACMIQCVSMPFADPDGNRGRTCKLGGRASASPHAHSLGIVHGLCQWRKLDLICC